MTQESPVRREPDHNHALGLQRRAFLKTAGLFSAAMVAGSTAKAAEPEGKREFHLATNQYSWYVFFRRENRDFGASLDEGFRAVAESGLQGFEPLATSPGQIDQMVPLLAKHGLQMRSLYVNSTLHVADEVEKSLTEVAAIAARAQQAGVRIIVTNPSPIRWGGPENKDDGQLKLQAESLNRLGEKLAGMGLRLAYHNHDIELRNAAREFHHMMLGTDPKLVSLCLDAHWIYRGAGNSSVALFDVLKLYGSRVVELHLRQSTAGVWSETFGEGDLDYQALAEHLAGLKLRPHLVLEQAVEQGTPKTMDAVESHRRSAEYARKVLSSLG
jgi:inosose dehydratase